MGRTHHRNRVIVIRGTAAAGTPKQPAAAQPPRTPRRIVVIRNGDFVASRPKG